MTRISANIGFLWDDLPLPERIERAAASGFEAVECHFPYEHPASEIAAVLDATGLHMVGLNTGLGPGGQEEFGVAARPGREQEARGLIDQAIEYAAVLGTDYVSVVAGRTGGGAEAEATLRDNLAYAAPRAAEAGISVVIEPLSERACPGYHLTLVEPGLETIAAVGAPNLGLMFDCFHVQVMQGDLTERLRTCLPHLGHVQISSVPDRAEPDHGEVAYDHILDLLDELGYDGWIGAEYRPRTTVEAGLGWLRDRREREAR